MEEMLVMRPWLSMPFPLLTRAYSDSAFNGALTIARQPDYLTADNIMGEYKYGPVSWHNRL